MMVSLILVVPEKMRWAIGFGFLLLAVITTCTADDPLKQATLIILNNCKTKAGASDDDAKAIQEKRLPETHSGLCMLECLLTRGNMMRDGKFNKQGFISAATPGLKGDADKIQKLKEMADACEKEIASSGADKCDSAKSVVTCTTQKGKSFGFKFPSRM